MERLIVHARCALVASSLVLSACTGGGKHDGGHAPTYTLGGTVAGLSGTGLVLQKSGGDDLAVSANGDFTFATFLADGAAYAVTVLTQPGAPAQTCTVTNGSGTIAGANVTSVAVACASAKKSWGNAALIETQPGAAYSPQIAVDASGNAFAVWRQVDGSGGLRVWANRYTVGQGWGTAAIIQTGTDPTVPPPSVPQVATDASGNAFAVWDEYDPGAPGNTNIMSIWVNRYTAGQGWGSPQLIETNADSAYAPQIVMNANGNAFAVWLQNSWSLHYVWSNHYTAGTGWGTAEKIETATADASSPPQIAIDSSGNAIAVWAQNAGAIGANRYTAGTGWGAAADLAARGSTPRIAMNASGNAVAVWDEWDATGSSLSVWSKLYSAGTGLGAGWQPAERLDSNLLSVSAPQVALAANGDAFATWRRFDGSTSTIVSAKHPAATTWGIFVRLDNGAGPGDSVQISVNPDGDALAVWRQYDGTRTNIWSNRRGAADVIWGTAELIETDNAGSANDPQIAVDAQGNALSVWRQNDATRDNIWANRFQ